MTKPRMIQVGALVPPELLGFLLFFLDDHGITSISITPEPKTKVPAALKALPKPLPKEPGKDTIAFKVLALAHKGEGPTAIAKALKKETSSISGVISSLKKRGLIPYARDKANG